MVVKSVVCYSLDLPSQNSLGYLRVIGPLQQAGIEFIDANKNDQAEVEKAGQGDAVFIQRNFPRKYGEYLKIVEMAGKAGKPVVFDLDDLLFSLPEDHPYRQSEDYTTSLLPMYQALLEADLVTVSTPKLRDILAEYNQHVVVLPNYLDDRVWRLTPPVRKSKKEPLVIGYMGTASHKPDLELIAPILLEIAQRDPERISFRFWAIEPPSQIRSFSQFIPTPRFSGNNEYRDFAAFFQEQSADIFIAPLAENQFNQCKSPIKFLEYSALGAPGVYSSLETYSGTVHHNVNGLLASAPEEWSQGLTRLIEDEDLRVQLAENAQTTVRENWLLSKNSYRWREAFDQLAEPGNTRAIRPHVGILQSINDQLNTFLRKAADQAAQSNQSLQETQRQLECSRAEALAFSQSTSWKITRPIRLLRDLLPFSRKQGT